jgi:hypothetical protein
MNTVKKSMFIEATRSHTHKHRLKSIRNLLWGGIFSTGITGPFSPDGTKPKTVTYFPR